MTLSTNVSVNTPMTAPLNQTHTTSPTEGSVDRGSRPSASRHILRALSTLSSRIGAVMVALLVFGLAGVAAPLNAQNIETIITKGQANAAGFF